MNLEAYTVDTLLLTAIKSEVESHGVYSLLAGRVKNALLKERLNFLAGEEARHRHILQGIFKEKFPDQDLELPEKSPVPLPRVIISDELMPLNEIFQMAMDAEKAAYDFYQGLAERFEEDDLVNVILYVARMELGHYELLKVESESLERFEEANIHIPFIHEGP
jgi:rubrerythrin